MTVWIARNLSENLSESTWLLDLDLASKEYMKTLYILFSEEVRAPPMARFLFIKKWQDCDFTKVMEQVIIRTGLGKKGIHLSPGILP